MVGYGLIISTTMIGLSQLCYLGVEIMSVKQSF